jgi:hypothetical protein
MKRIMYSLRVLALTVVLLTMSVVPASGMNKEGTHTAGTHTAKFCDYGRSSLPPAAEAGDRPSSP